MGKLEKVQNRAARLVTGNSSHETGSMNDILAQQNLEFLKQSRKQSALILLHEGIKRKPVYPRNTLLTQIDSVKICI